MENFRKNTAWWLLAGAIPTGMIALSLMYPTNRAVTLPDHKNPRLRTRFYPLRGSIDEMQRQIEAIIPKLTTYGTHWRLVHSRDRDTASNHTLIRAEVPVFFFTDDLEIRLEPTKNNQEVRVDIQSAARLGTSDLGENQRHVLTLLAALDKQLGAQ